MQCARSRAARSETRIAHPHRITTHTHTAISLFLAPRVERVERVCLWGNNPISIDIRTYTRHSHTARQRDRQRQARASFAYVIECLLFDVSLAAWFSVLGVVFGMGVFGLVSTHVLMYESKYALIYTIYMRI